MPFRRLIAASLLATPVSVFAAENSPLPDSISLSTSNYTVKDGVGVAEPDETGDPVISFGDMRLSAHRIVYDQNARIATAEGGVTVNAFGLRILTDGAKYTGDERTLGTGKIRLGRPPFFLDANGLKIATDTAGKLETTSASLGRVVVHYNEPDGYGFSISADKIGYDSKSEKLTAEDVVFWVGPLPVLWLPAYSQDGVIGTPIEPEETQAGVNNRYGAYLRTNTFYTANAKWQPGLLLDGYGKAGVLLGPALRYDTRATPGNLMRGSLRIGFIEDHTGRGADQFGDAIPESRRFIDWRHKQTVADAVEITGSVHAWSDPFATRDFRRRLFDREQQPDNFVEVVYPTRDYYASVFARFRPNEWQDVDQRLPEVRFDLNPKEIADSRIYARGHISVGYLREETSRERPFLPGATDGVLATPRVDGYFGLTRPWNPSPAFSFTPVLGARSTTWFDALGGGDIYSRLAGQAGFDMRTQFSAVWNLDSAVWALDGLRHVVRPVFQYRRLPGATDGAGRIPVIEASEFIAAPPPIDLSQRRDTDRIFETQIARIGLENLLQTRDSGYGSRNLLTFDIHQDFRDTREPGAETISDTYLSQRFTPAPWLEMRLYERVDLAGGTLREISSQTVFRDGDRWTFTLGTQHVTDAISVDQYFLGGEYRVNSIWAVRGVWRYDADRGSLAEQTYSLVQQLGHTWQIEYVVGNNQNARGDTGFNFGVRLRLVTF